MIETLVGQGIQRSSLLSLFYSALSEVRDHYGVLRRLDFRVIDDVVRIVLGSIGVRSHCTDSTSASSDLFDHVRLVRSIAIGI